MRELADIEPLGLANSLGTRNGVIPILAEHIDVVARACKGTGNGNGYGGGGGYGNGYVGSSPEGYTLDGGGGVNVYFEGKEGSEWKDQGRRVVFFLRSLTRLSAVTDVHFAPIFWIWILIFGDSSRLAAESLCDMLGLKSVETVNVKHRVRAYGIVMTHRDGWRVVYVSFPSLLFSPFHFPSLC